MFLLGDFVKNIVVHVYIHIYISLPGIEMLLKLVLFLPNSSGIDEETSLRHTCQVYSAYRHKVIWVAGSNFFVRKGFKIAEPRKPGPLRCNI